MISSDADPLPTPIARLKEAVLSKRPILRQILADHGDLPLREYAQRYHMVASPAVGADRRSECIQVITAETQRQLGHDVAASVERQLSHHYYLSTADHLGPLVHPFFLSLNLLRAADYVESRNPNHANVISLACGSISLENSSFPRGVLFHSQATPEAIMQRFPFLSSHIRPSLVNYVPSYTEADMAKVDDLISTKVRSNEITDDEAQRLRAFLADYYLDPHVLASHNFSSQLTKSNWALWKQYFPATAAVPNLVSLELETVVNQLLKHHLSKPTFIHQLLFNPSWAEHLNRFEGIQGAFNRTSKYGTELFWAVPPNSKHRVQLWRQGTALCTDDGSYRVELNPDALARALAANELIPSLLVSYILLACYYGLELLGGFSQTTYLTDMKAAYLTIARDVADDESLAVAEPVKTDKLGGEFVLAYLETANGDLVPATGLDLMLHGNATVSWERFLGNASQITLEQTLDPMLPEFYRIIYPDSVRDPDLMAITPEAITAANGSQSVIQPCASLKSVA
jgi:hypothetical protein